MVVRRERRAAAPRRRLALISASGRRAMPNARARQPSTEIRRDRQRRAASRSQGRSANPAQKTKSSTRSEENIHGNSK
eukprot:3553286-Pleurochrysis_carterae.AAC.1